MTPTDKELEALALKLGRALQVRGWRLAAAESCTGGWIGKTLTDVAGSSQWFEGGVVSYSNVAKMKLLGVPADVLRAHGAVAEETVRAMADGARQRGLEPLARLVAFGAHAQDPLWFTTAPVTAARTALKRAGWSVGEVDLWEVNEAFAVVPLAFMQELGVAPDRVNVRGGAISLGHPIGASGARILVTLLAALRERGAKRGVAAICIGGGEGLAACVELI